MQLWRTRVHHQVAGRGQAGGAHLGRRADGTGVLQVPVVAPSVPFASCFNYDVAPSFTLNVGEDKTFSIFFEPKDADEGDQTGTLNLTLANDTSTSHALVVAIKGRGGKAGSAVTHERESSCGMRSLDGGRS